MGGRGALGLDCFFFILVRVLFAKWKASSSNSRFIMAVDAKGLFCKMYLPRVIIIIAPPGSFDPNSVQKKTKSLYESNTNPIQA
jgi:hypothetical protein